MERTFWMKDEFSRVENGTRLRIRWWKYGSGESVTEYCVIFDKDPNVRPECDWTKKKGGNTWTFSGYSPQMEKKAKKMAVSGLKSYKNWNAVLSSLK